MVAIYILQLLTFIFTLTHYLVLLIGVDFYFHCCLCVRYVIHAANVNIGKEGLEGLV